MHKKTNHSSIFVPMNISHLGHLTKKVTYVCLKENYITDSEDPGQSCTIWLIILIAHVNCMLIFKIQVQLNNKNGGSYLLVLSNNEKHTEVNISKVKNVRAFLPVIIVVFLRINTIE